MASKNNIYDILIWVVSILVPVVVALLLFTKWEYDQLVFDMRIPNYDPVILMDNLPIAKPLTFLPPIYATINGLTAVLLVIAVYYIKNGKRKILIVDDICDEGDTLKKITIIPDQKRL